MKLGNRSPFTHILLVVIILHQVGCTSDAEEEFITTDTITFDGEYSEQAIPIDSLFERQEFQFVYDSGINFTIDKIRNVCGKDDNDPLVLFGANFIVASDSSGQHIADVAIDEKVIMQSSGCSNINDTTSVFIVDYSRQAIQIYLYPQLEKLITIQLSQSADDVHMDDQGNVVVFSHKEEFLLTKYDINERITGNLFKVRSRELSDFLFRFHDGGIASVEGEGFYFIYPDKYRIFKINDQFDLESIIMGGSNSRWRPDAKEFPKHLSPFEFTPAHVKWWDSFEHIESIYALGNDYVFVSVFASEGYGTQLRYVNLYRLDGSIVREGIMLREGERILGVKGKSIFTKIPSFVDNNGNLTNAVLYQLTLK